MVNIYCHWKRAHYLVVKAVLAIFRHLIHMVDLVEVVVDALLAAEEEDSLVSISWLVCLSIGPQNFEVLGISQT